MRHDLWLDPLDAVFFGEPRSFVAGESHAAGSRFPPSPFTFQGMLRTHLLTRAALRFSLQDRRREARQEREALVGTSDALPDGWQITAPLPARLHKTRSGDEVEPWAATPRHLMGPPTKRRPTGAQIKGDEVPRRARRVSLRDPAAAPGREIALLSDLGSGSLQLLSGGPTHTAPLGGWVSAANLAWALTGQGAWDAGGFTPGELPPMVSVERRPGIALHAEDRDGHARGTTVDGMLYELKMLRFEPRAGLWGALEAPAPLPGGISEAPERLLVGRKAQAVALAPSPPPCDAWRSLQAGAHLARASEEGWAWLVLLSPAALREPTRPDLPQVAGARATVEGALVGPPVVHGGFAFEKAGGRGQARANRRCAPPGSAWLIRLEGDPPARRALLSALHLTHSLGDEALRPFGFGYTAVGIAPTGMEDDA